jgi:hypothetical protein
MRFGEPDVPVQAAKALAARALLMEGVVALGKIRAVGAIAAPQGRPFR